MLISQLLTQLFASQQQQLCFVVISEVENLLITESWLDTVTGNATWSDFDMPTETGISSISQCDC